MSVMQRNLKATSLLNISLGLFLISMFLDPLIKGNARIITYFGIIMACLLILSGLYNFFVFLKNQKIVPDKKYGYFSLIIGSLFIISTIISWFNLRIEIISFIFGILSGILAMILGILLLREKGY